MSIKLDKMSGKLDTMSVKLDELSGKIDGNKETIDNLVESVAVMHKTMVDALKVPEQVLEHPRRWPQLQRPQRRRANSLPPRMDAAAAAAVEMPPGRSGQVQAQQLAAQW